MAENRPTPTETDSVRTYAREFLHNLGTDTTGLRLDIRDYKDHVVYLSDRKRWTFLLMVRQPWTELVTERVLAYSTRCGLTQIRSIDAMDKLFNHYDTLVHRMAQDGIREQPVPLDSIQNVKPLMPKIHWTQTPLYGMFEGQNGHVVTGCGAVALGQVMKFHQWPDTVRGHIAYTDRDKREIRMDMDGIPIHWPTIKNTYKFHDPDSLTLDTLMRCVSTAIKSHFGKRGTISFPYNLRPALVNHFGYSPDMRQVVRSQMPEAEMQRLIRQEIRDGRPVILSGGQHIFLCDGVSGSFLHLNMGWYGTFDGWYRFPIIGTDINKNAFLVTALVRIMPLRE